MKIVLCSGGFDPLHIGHINYLTAASTLGDRLFVGVNSDEWLLRKKGSFFMNELDRVAIVRSLGVVDDAYLFDDLDDSAHALIRGVKEDYPDDDIIFANGGDRGPNNVMETDIKDISFAWKVGGEEKQNSSSTLLSTWVDNSNITPRIWGHYKVLYDIPGIKAKQLVIKPGHGLSYQKHEFRLERWFIASGDGKVTLSDETFLVNPGSEVRVDQEEWHSIENIGQEDLVIIEIQKGSICDEEDIIRKKLNAD